MDWRNYWPELEYWVSWQSWVTLAVAMGAVMIGFVASRWGRAIGIAALAFITLYAIALTEKIKTEPDRDYAYFFIEDGEAALPNGTIQLHHRAIGPLANVSVAFVRDIFYSQNRYEYGNKSAHFSEGSGYDAAIQPADWWIDIDPLPRAGQVKERLNIAINNGRAATIFAQVRRKFGSKEILCETPPRDGIKPCH